MEPAIRRFGQTPVSNFFIHENLRDHSYNFAAGPQRRVRKNSHEANMAASVYDSNVPMGQCPGQSFGGKPVNLAMRGARTAENANAPDHSSATCRTL
jgi:hypothetical protein